MAPKCPKLAQNASVIFFKVIRPHDLSENHVFLLLLLGGFLAGCETSGPRWAEAEVRVNL